MLVRTINSLGWPLKDEAEIGRIVEAGSFARLKELEARNAYNDRRLAAASADDPESYKIRRGKIGGFVDYLSKSDIDYINGYLRDHLDPLYDVYR